MTAEWSADIDSDHFSASHLSYWPTIIAARGVSEGKKRKRFYISIYVYIYMAYIYLQTTCFAKACFIRRKEGVQRVHFQTGLPSFEE